MSAIETVQMSAIVSNDTNVQHTEEVPEQSSVDNVVDEEAEAPPQNKNKNKNKNNKLEEKLNKFIQFGVYLMENNKNITIDELFEKLIFDDVDTKRSMVNDFLENKKNIEGTIKTRISDRKAEETEHLRDAKAAEKKALRDANVAEKKALRATKAAEKKALRDANACVNKTTVSRRKQANAKVINELQNAPEPDTEVTVTEVEKELVVEVADEVADEVEEKVEEEVVVEVADEVVVEVADTAKKTTKKTAKKTAKKTVPKTDKKTAKKGTQEKNEPESEDKNTNTVQLSNEAYLDEGDLIALAKMSQYTPEH